MNFEALKHILFIDLETVAAQPRFEDLEERFQPLWEKKAKNLKSEQEPAESYAERAAIYAEFGKIIVIGVGYFVEMGGELQFKCKALAGDDEKMLLASFAAMLDQISAREMWRLCAHNGKEFDFPYLCRRFIINELPIPKLMNSMGKKPWETAFLDTMEMWKFGDFKAYTSLELMAACLGVPSSKSDIDGSQVGKVYYETGDIQRIAAYCCQDVAVLGQIYMRLMGFGYLNPDQIIINE